LAREGRLEILVANIGGETNHLIVRSGVARAEHESREIKKRAARGTAEAKKRGVKYGNPDLPAARLKAWPKKTENAKKRRALFEAAALEAERSGARTGDQIARAFNERGFKNPSGGLWTAENVYSTRRRKKSSDLKEKARDDVSAPASSLKVGADGKLGSDDVERLCAEMIARGAEPAKINTITAALAAGVPSEEGLRHVEKFMARAAAKRR
jgi:hypothetical protein